MTDLLVVATEWNSAHGGISSFNRSLCIAIAAAGRAVTCFLPRFSSEEASDARENGVTLLAAKPPPGVRGKDALLCGLPEPLDFGAVVGHGRITGPAATAIRAKHNPNAPYVHFFHMDPKETEWEKEPVDGVYPPDVLRERVSDEVELAKTADLIFGVGPQLTRSFGAYMRPEGKHVHEFCPGLITCSTATVAGASKDCLLFGRVEDYRLKGVDKAAKAMALLARERPLEFSTARLTVLGAQPDQGTILHDRLRKEAPEAKTIVEGYTSDRKEVSLAILRSSLVLMPSRTEGFGLAGLEAVSHGVPVLISAQSGLAEALLSYVPGHSDDHIVSLHLRRSVQTLAQRIADKLANPQQAYARAAALRTAMASMFSWQRSVAAFLEQLDGARRKGGAPPTPTAADSEPAAPPPDSSTASASAAPEAGDHATDAVSVQAQDSSDPTATIVQRLRDTSTALATWPQTLTTKQWLERPQLAEIKAGLLASEAQRYWLLGPPGSGKSAFLSRLLTELRDDGVAVFGIKADQLPPKVDDTKSLAEFLRLEDAAEDLILAIAKVRRVVVVLDQLDALSDIVDLQTRRLGALLDLLRILRRSDNVSVVASCRAFDFAHDIRFRELGYDEIQLAPLTAAQVESALSEAGVVPGLISIELRELLKVPHWLNVFLRLRRSGSKTHSASHHSLLEELWTTATRAAGAGSEQLLSEIAEAMAKDEILWLPFAQFTDRRDCVERLEREEILRREETRLRIGFAHQTFFEFAHARAFVSNRSLSATVRAAGYSLFVRPLMWTALGYLREASPKLYTVELLALANDTAMRMHLRALLLQFVGQVAEPTGEEVRVMSRAIEESETHPVAIKAIFGRVPWFKALRQTLMRFMTTKPSSASVLLQGVASTEQNDVLTALRQHWLPDPARHDLIAWILIRAANWLPPTVELAETLIKDGTLSKHVEDILLATAAKLVSKDALRLYALWLNRLVASRLKSIQPEPQPAEDAPDSERIRWAMHREPRTTLARLLHDAADLPSLGDLAKQNPREFLGAIWPWYLEVLNRAADEPNSEPLTFRHVYMYEADPWERRFPVFGSIIGDAIRHLAMEWTHEWRTFVTQNSSSNIDTVHQCILCGFESSLPEHLSQCAEYLLGDPRRLVIGDHTGSDSVRILDALAPFADRDILDALRSAAQHARLVDEGDMSATVDLRRLRREVNQRHRERLLKALAKTEAVDSDDDDETYGRGTGVQWIDSHISAEQMGKMADPHILGLFSELVDTTEFNHPKRFMSGGSIQATRVLGEVVRKFPERKERYAALSQQFSPTVNQRPAAAIFEALLDIGYGLANGTELLLKLDQLGFRSAEFRWTAAYAVEKLANVNEAADVSLLSLLESWLEDAGEIEALEDDDKESQEILWGWGMGGALPHGNFPVLLAITKLLLLRATPDPHQWSAVLLRHLRRRESPRVWLALLPHLDNLRFAGKQGAEVLVELFQKFPEVRDSIPGARLIGHATWWVEQDVAELWIREIGRSSWRLSQRAYGELIGLLVTRQSHPDWLDNEVNIVLSRDGSEHRRLGVLTAAAHLWENSETREKANALLLAGCRVAESKPERDMIMRTFDLSGESALDSQAREFLHALQARPEILRGRSLNFVKRMSTFLTSEPELISDLVMSYVRQRLGEDLMEKQEIFSEGPVLANLAVTLHRSPPPLRDLGLDLMELLLVTESYGATEVLTEVDRGHL